MKKKLILTLIISVLFLGAVNKYGGSSPRLQNVSKETQECIDCHTYYSPGIVNDWLSSLHSKTTPLEALGKPKLQRRVSNENIPSELQNYVVGCFECHSRNVDSHKDSFEHNGYKINVIVSPNDCKTCHLDEANQYSESKKSYAYDNLMSNPVYHMLVNTIDGVSEVRDGNITTREPSGETLTETCLGCHGTKVEVKGMKTIQLKDGTIDVPDLKNWPNQGVGRINPDGSRGACTSCHPRHSFSIEIARKPYTCSQCHLEPDVPAWDVYKESKHGNIFFSKETEWNYTDVPWVVGKDFKAPTCAVCHNSLIVSEDGEVKAERSHDFGARLWVRLFGLIYTHPQPKSGNTSIIKNSDGLPLPTAFTGKLASEFLIDKAEMDKRKSVMMNVCESCHSTNWTINHFNKMDVTLKETDEMTLAATQLMVSAWDKGLENNKNPFDEIIEKHWVKQWLFYGNSIKYSSAMTGAPDYSSFKLGWWELSENLQEMKELIEAKQSR
jgi:hydroxylamine dehydrogenase